MNEALITAIRLHIALHGRGDLTAQGFVVEFLNLLLYHEASSEDIEAGFRTIPDELLAPLQLELHTLTDSAFCRRATSSRDTRTKDELLAEFRAQQPAFRRICQTLNKLLLLRQIAQESG